MSGSSDWPGDETAETQGTGLPPAERQILVALAVVGNVLLGTFVVLLKVIVAH